LFALNEGANSISFLAAGGLGFLAFTIGHFFMVRYTLQRTQVAVLDIEEIWRSAPNERAYPRIIGTLVATGVGVRHAMVAHVAIDLCVIAAFLAKMIAVCQAMQATYPIIGR